MGVKECLEKGKRLNAAIKAHKEGGSASSDASSIKVKKFPKTTDIGTGLTLGDLMKQQGLTHKEACAVYQAYLASENPAPKGPTPKSARLKKKEEGSTSKSTPKEVSVTPKAKPSHARSFPPAAEKQQPPQPGIKRKNASESLVADSDKPPSAKKSKPSTPSTRVRSKGRPDASNEHKESKQCRKEREAEEQADEEPVNEPSGADEEDEAEDAGADEAMVEGGEENGQGKEGDAGVGEGAAELHGNDACPHYPDFEDELKAWQEERYMQRMERAAAEWEEYYDWLDGVDGEPLESEEVAAIQQAEEALAELEAAAGAGPAAAPAPTTVALPEATPPALGPVDPSTLETQPMDDDSQVCFSST